MSGGTLSQPRTVFGSRLALLSIILAFVFAIGGCRNTPDPADQGAPPPIPDQPVSVLDEPGYRLMECRWHDDDTALLVFNKPGPESRLRLALLDLSTGECDILFDDAGYLDYGGNMLVTRQSIALHAVDRTLVFDRHTLQLTAKQELANRTGRYSWDMAHVALIRDHSLYIQVAESIDSRLLDSVPESPEEEHQLTYISLNWSPDSSKLVYIADYMRSQIGVIDVASGTKRILTGNTDFPYPEGWVDLMRCWFLPNSADLLIDIPCETESVLLVLLGDDDYRSHRLVDEAADITLMAMRGEQLLYAVRSRDSDQNDLVCYDYRSGTRQVLHSSNAYLMAADFSPDGGRVLFVTYAADGHHTHVVELAGP